MRSRARARRRTAAPRVPSRRRLKRRDRPAAGQPAPDRARERRAQQSTDSAGRDDRAVCGRPRDRVRVEGQQDDNQPFSDVRRHEHQRRGQNDGLRTTSASAGRKLAPRNAYLTQLRVDRACELLRDGWSVGETALAVGFRSRGHLALVFRERTDVHPSRYV